MNSANFAVMAFYEVQRSLVLAKEVGFYFSISSC